MSRGMGTALVTGSSSGIGLHIARELARRGFDVALTARRRERLEEAGREIGAAGVRTWVFTGDLGAAGGVERLVREVDAAGVEVDVLVNNAGFGLRAAFIEGDAAKLMEMVRVNVGAVTELTRVFLPRMVERARADATMPHPVRGVLNVASAAAYAPGPYMAVYYASKAYVESLSVALAEEVRGEPGVRVTALCPGPVRTEFGEVAGTDHTGVLKRATVTDVAVVARRAVSGFVRGDSVVMPGVGNRVVTLAARLMSRRLLARVVRGVQGPG